MFTRSVIPALLLLAAGCAAPLEPADPNPVTFVVDARGATPEHLEMIANAAAEWSALGVVSVRTEITDSADGVDPRRLVRVVPWAAIQIYPGTTRTTVGLFDEPIGILLAAENPCFPSTAAHEMGHALGLGHNPAEESVMYWTCLQAAPAPTELDREALLSR